MTHSEENAAWDIIIFNFPSPVPDPHLQQFVLLASPLFPLVDDAAPQDPGVLLQVWQVGGGRGAGHQRGAAVAPWTAHRPHGLGIRLQQPAWRDRKLKLQLFISDGKGTHDYIAQYVRLTQDGTHALESDGETKMSIRSRGRQIWHWGRLWHCEDQYSLWTTLQRHQKPQGLLL